MTTSTIPWHEILGLRQLWSCHQLWTKKIQLHPAPPELSANSGFVVALFPRGRASPRRPSCTSRHCEFGFCRGSGLCNLTRPSSTSRFCDCCDSPSFHKHTCQTPNFRKKLASQHNSKRARRSRSHLSPHPSSVCHSPSTVRKRLCCCDNSTRELLWHSEHKERGESRDSELPLAHIPHFKRQLDATRPTSQSYRKRETTSLDQFCQSTSMARISTPRSQYSTLFLSKAVVTPNETFWAAILSQFSQVRRGIPVQPKGKFPQPSCADQSRCMLSLFRLKNRARIRSPCGRPWNVPMRGCCAQTHAVPRIQQRPNPFPQRLVPHLWYHA